MILVTGGTGIVGAHLLYSLVRDNERVRAICRKNSDVDSVKKIFALYTSEIDSFFDRIEWVVADITDIPALTQVFGNVSSVYHCAALISFNPAHYKQLRKINVEGTANVVNLCLAKKVSKLCYVSSVATFGSAPAGKHINEQTYWNPDSKNNVYAITKYDAEMEVWRGTQEGLDAVIVNPGVIFGISPKNGGSGMIPKIASRGTRFYPSGAMGMVDVKDVTRAMIALMNSSIKNEQFILVGQNVTYKEVLEKFADLYNNKPPRIKLSKPLMLFLSSLEWLVSALFGVRRRLDKAIVHSMFSQSLYDSSKIKEHLGFEFTPWEATLAGIEMADKG